MPNFRLSKSSLKNIEGINPKLLEITYLAITITKIDYGHGEFSGLRSNVDQKELFADGKSKADGYNNKSYHQSGNALDFYAYVDGRASWLPEHLAMVATAHLQAASILGYPLEWGGNFKGFRDMPHIQLQRV